MNVSAIIPAAGSGERFGEVKQFKLLVGRPLLFQTLKPFLQSKNIHEIVVVVHQDDLDATFRDVLSISAGKSVKVVAGGKLRQDSVKNGVDASDSNSTLVCIHDAARPFVTEDLIQKSISACENADGSVVAIQSQDTVKYSKNRTVEKTIARENIWLAQTPQTFNKEKLLLALDNAETNQLTGTDESAIMEAMGYNIKLVEGDLNNFKITKPGDWMRAEAILHQQAQRNLKND